MNGADDVQAGAGQSLPHNGLVEGDGDAIAVTFGGG